MAFLKRRSKKKTKKKTLKPTLKNPNGHRTCYKKKSFFI